jgi:VWFA-related protein
MNRHLVAISLWVGTLAAAVAGQQAPRFRVRVDAVQVDVSVMRGGRPVAGLTAANFELRDTNVVQRVEAVTMEDVPVHLLLVLDTSGSVRGRTLADLQDATVAALESLGTEDCATVLTFSQHIAQFADASADRDGASRAIAAAVAGGWTSLDDALLHALVLRGGDTRRALVLLFSDGQDTASWLAPDTVLEDARRNDVIVYSVMPRPLWYAEGLSSQNRFDGMRRRRLGFATDPRVFRDFLLFAVSEETGGEVVFTGADRDLRALFLGILREFKSRYLLTYTPEGVPPDGWHPIEVRLKGARGEVKARRGYQR